MFHSLVGTNSTRRSDLAVFQPHKWLLEAKKTCEEETQTQIPRYLVSQYDLSSSFAIHVLTGTCAKIKQRTTPLTNQLYVKWVLQTMA